MGLNVGGVTDLSPTRAGVADDLSAQGSGLRARQTKRSPLAPEKLTPALNLRETCQ